MEAVNTDRLSSNALHQLNKALGQQLEGDCVFINSDMFSPLDDEFRVVLEQIREHDSAEPREHLVVVIQTAGGYMETVERLVAVMRAHYERVSFIIPNYAYSAGTVLALSGDDIYMDYYSVLGPIDPQFRGQDGTPISGYGILAKFDEIRKTINEADTPEECRAELAYLVKKFDPGHLFGIEQAIQRGISLITKWLPKYKFKDWATTASTGQPVTGQLKRERAKEIAETLGDASRWHSHGRGIPMRELSGSELKLVINDFGGDPELNGRVRNYHGLAVDYSGKVGLKAYIHSQLGFRRVA